jgi:hypothetical protein
MFEKDREARREAEEAFRQLVKRVDLQLNRISHRRPKAAYWDRLHSLEMRLRYGRMKVTSLSWGEEVPDVPDYDAWSAYWKPLETARQQLHQEIDKLSHSMKSPSPPWLEALNQRRKAATTWLEGTKKRAVAFATRSTRRTEQGAAGSNAARE